MAIAGPSAHRGTLSRDFELDRLRRSCTHQQKTVSPDRIALRVTEAHIMAPRTTAIRDDREGLSPPALPFALAAIWDDDDDDIEFEPASEQSEDMSQGDTGEDGESDYMGIAAFSYG